MGRSKQPPVHNPRAFRGVGASTMNAPTHSTNAGAGEMMRWFYSDYSTDDQLPGRIDAAYPLLTQAPTDPYASLQAFRSWQGRWFTTANDPAWLRIRCMVFKHLFAGGIQYILPRTLSADDTTTWVCSDDDKIASILFVNKQLRAEALPHYHTFVLMDIDACSVPADWFANSAQVDRHQLRHVQFKAWQIDEADEEEPPKAMVEQLLDTFPQLETIIIEAPADEDHYTINSSKKKGGKLTVKDINDQVAGFGGLLNNKVFQNELATIDFGGTGLDRKKRKEFNAAVLKASQKVKEMRGKDGLPLKVKLALPVDLYSDLWLSWRAKRGESLKDLIVPPDGEVEPHMEAMAVVDFEERLVEWTMNHHRVVVEMD